MIGGMAISENIAGTEPVRRKHRGVVAGLAAVMVAAVAWVSFLPSSDKAVLHTRGRFHSLGHLVAFSAMSFLLLRSSGSAKVRVALFCGALALGWAIEYAEHVVFGSRLERRDILVDALGVVLGSVVALV